jgi:hypothetical protein
MDDEAEIDRRRRYWRHRAVGNKRTKEEEDNKT